jgi:glutamate-5-semialdehyde dehydrogenase
MVQIIMGDLIQTLASQAKSSLPYLMAVDEDVLVKSLHHFADALLISQREILQANQTDILAAQDKNISPAMIDRLTLTPARVQSIAQSVHDIANLPSPINKTLASWDRPNGLNISRVSVPLGVLGIIYESRPNVTVDAACLSLKSRNVCILRGGSESFHTSKMLYDLLINSLQTFDIPTDAVGFVNSTDRALVGDMLSAVGLIDVIIPRGGKNLTERVMNEAKMPVFAHLDGICHTYIHHAANADMARDICINAKMRRTGVCGATETILIDRNFDAMKIKMILSALIDAGCELVGDDDIQKLDARIGAATDDDWRTEYLAAKCAVKYVDDINDAIHHINHYGSHHTDAIITDDANAATEFLNKIDSAIIIHNASTQFADGGEFGMGAEIGIATGRFHARGPVGLEQLTTYKYIVKGNGQTRPV